MKVKEITSEQNETYKGFVALTRSRGVKKKGAALLSGPKQVQEVLRDFPDHCRAFIFSQRERLEAEVIPEGVQAFLLRPELFRRIDLFGTGHPVLVVRVPSFGEWSDDCWPPGCTLCIPFQDPANVGAAIRSAAAFGVSRVVLLREAAHPFHPKSLRVAGSHVFRVAMLEGPSLDRLKVEKAPVVTLSPGQKDVGEYIFPPAFCLVPGLEGPGLSPHLRQANVLSVPMEPGVESINAALATGIVLYVWRTRSRPNPRG